MHLVRGPTLFGLAAVLATMALVFAFAFGTGTASASVLAVPAPGFVTVGGTDDPFQAQLITSNTSLTTQGQFVNVGFKAVFPDPVQAVGSTGLQFTDMNGSRGSPSTTADANGSQQFFGIVTTPFGLLVGLVLVLAGANAIVFRNSLQRFVANFVVGGRLGTRRSTMGSVLKTPFVAFTSFVVAMLAHAVGFYANFVMVAGAGRTPTRTS